MKFKTTRKEIVNHYSNIVSVGYCDLADLLHGCDAKAYTCGTYGWNFDMYYEHGLCICTGYRNMPGRKANNILEYNQKARAIWENCSMPWEEQKAAVAELLKEFCAQA